MTAMVCDKSWRIQSKETRDVTADMAKAKPFSFEDYDTGVLVSSGLAGSTRSVPLQARRWSLKVFTAAYCPHRIRDEMKPMLEAQLVARCSQREKGLTCGYLAEAWTHPQSNITGSGKLQQQPQKPGFTSRRTLRHANSHASTSNHQRLHLLPYSSSTPRATGS